MELKSVPEEIPSNRMPPESSSVAIFHTSGIFFLNGVARRVKCKENAMQPASGAKITPQGTLQGHVRATLYHLSAAHGRTLPAVCRRLPAAMKRPPRCDGLKFSIACVFQRRFIRMS
jgi:hypothetical protein